MMKERYCHNCNRPLNYMDYLDCNSHLSVCYLENIWEHPNVELLCCDCFKQVNLLELYGIPFKEISGKLMLNRLKIM